MGVYKSSERDLGEDMEGVKWDVENNILKNRKEIKSSESYRRDIRKFYC